MSASKTCIGPEFRWGEADQLVASTAIFEVQFGPVLVDTIDWDMVLSMLCCDSTGMTIRFGNIWTDGTPDVKFFSFGKAKKMLEKPPIRCAEFVDCPRLVENFPGTDLLSPAEHRLQAAAMFLFCGGCDYNAGLSLFVSPPSVSHLIETTS